MEEKDVIEGVAKIAAQLNERTSELTVEMVNRYEQELPHLVHDDERMVSLLGASVYQNVDNVMRVFQHGIELARVEAPAAAIEYARRLAQRGTPVVDLIRAYQLGQTVGLDHAFAEGAKQVDDPELMGAMMRHAMTVTANLLDRVIQQAISAYEEERDRWLLNRSAVRAARVRTLLNDPGIDLDASETAIGYRLRGTHLGMIAWQSDTGYTGNTLVGLETLAFEVADRLGAGRPLFVPCDEASAWAWLPLDEPVRPDRKLVEQAIAGSEPGIRLALGEPGQGAAGFRLTHRQALRVQGLGMLAGAHGERVMTFAEVGAVALMVGDLDSARAWVADTLGPMATADETHERLRETLRVFLENGGSYTAAATQLTMHKNTVQYRVRKAKELLDNRIDDNRLDVELALALCRWLGSAVLDR